MANKIKHFVLPNSLISQLTECTAGFALVYINDKGEPDIIIKADNEMTKMGIIKFCGHTFSSIDEMNSAELRGELMILDDDEDGCADPNCDCHDDE